MQPGTPFVRGYCTLRSAKLTPVPLETQAHAITRLYGIIFVYWVKEIDYADAGAGPMARVAGEPGVPR